MAEGVYKSYVNRVGESLLWHARSLSSKAEDERAEVNEEVKEEPKEPANEMADGLNEARALRVTEIMRDYQGIQSKIAQYNVAVPPSAQNQPGFMILRQSQAEARSLLNSPYPVELLHPPTGAGEAQKRQLQRVILDASARRFRAQRCFMRATAAMKWINKYRQLTPGNKPPTPEVRAALQQAENAMRAEINSATNPNIYGLLRNKDQAANYWQKEDPSLAALQTWMANNN